MQKTPKKSAAEPHWLASEAPVGEYLVDAVALELFYRGAADSGGEDEVVRTVRENVSVTARLAANSAKIHLRWRPEKLRQTKRFFEDLDYIQLRIRRNKRLSRLDLQMFSKRRSIPKVRNQDLTEALLSILELADLTIQDYLESYQALGGKGGNYDWRTLCFIDEVFELWCRYVRVDLYDEARVFNKLLAAAWRDVKFPTQEEDGRRLEDWLADRVRKHFPDGVGSSRRDCQERDLELAKERMRVPGPGELAKERMRVPGPGE